MKDRSSNIFVPIICTGELDVNLFHNTSHKKTWNYKTIVILQSKVKIRNQKNPCK